MHTVNRCALSGLALLSASCSFFEPDVGSLKTCLNGAPYSPGYAYGDSGAYAGKSPATYGPVSGNLLISDQYNNRVMEVTRGGTLVWSFGDGMNTPGPTSIVAPNDAERLPGGRTLIAATGAPPGGDPACPAAGCPDNRVLIVDDASGSILWQYGQDNGVAGAGDDALNQPISAVLVPQPGGDDHVLISDSGNGRVIEVTMEKSVSWRFPAATSTEQVTPGSAERLSNGHTLISDIAGNRVIEVDAAGSSIVWQYPAQADTKLLQGPTFASRLPGGNTLIADSLNGRVVEVDGSSPPAVVWSYATAGRNPCTASPQPSRAVRLADGHTLITDQFNDQVIEVDHASPARLLYTYGELGKWGTAQGLLWAPYDAKVVGDFTGLTPPN